MEAKKPNDLILWLGPVVVLGVIWGLQHGSTRPPDPLDMSAPREKFSEARAKEIARKLCDELGPHPIGSRNIVTASEYLASELKKIRGLEVEVQRAQGTNHLALYNAFGMVFNYRVINVVARLPGKNRDALLLNAHFDSPAESPGAGDNGKGASVAFETMRALAEGPPLEQTVILLLNGGEEAGSVGAAGFLQHPWARDVRAFIDLDGSPGGKAVLLQASAKYPALLAAYSRVAPAPQASVIMQDVLDSGITGASGDFEPLATAGIPGLDFAGIGDTWAVHTDLDLTNRLEPGSTQHMGDTMLAIARELTRGPMVYSKSGGHTYFDIFSRVAVIYSPTTARVLALAALALLIASLVRLRRAQPQLTAAVLLRSLGWVVLSCLAALFAQLAVAALLGLVLGRPHGWFSAPILLVPCFVGGGLLGALGLHALWRRRAEARGLSQEESALAAWAGALIWWGLLLLLSALKSVGAGYIALLWVLPSSAALLLGLLAPQWRWALWLASLGIGSISAIALGSNIPGFVGLAGQSGGIGPAIIPPLDFNLGVLVWLMIVFPIAPCALVVAHRATKIRPAILVCVAITLVGVVLTATRSPYDTRRVKRIIASHVEHNGETALLLSTMDDTSLRVAVAAAGLADAQPIPKGQIWPGSYFPGLPAPYEYRLPAARLTSPPPRIEILQKSEAQGVRTVKLRIFAGGELQAPQRRLLNVIIPHKNLVGWSLGDIPRPESGDVVYAVYSAPSTDGEDLTLQLRGPEPVEIEVYEVHAAGMTKELLDLKQKAPAWTNVMTHTMQDTKLKL